MGRFGLFTGLFLLCLALSYTHIALSASLPSLSFTDFTALSPDQQDSYTTKSPFGLIKVSVPTTASDFNFKEEREPSLLSSLFQLFSTGTPSSIQSVFHDDNITWLPLSHIPTLQSLLFSAFSSLHITLAASEQFDVITTSKFDESQSLNSEHHSCISISTTDHEYKQKRLQIQYQQRLAAQNNKGIDNIFPSKQHDFYTEILESDVNLSYQCKITIPLYSYLSPLTRGYIGIRSTTSPFRRAKRFISSQSNDLDVFISYKTQTFNIPHILLTILATVAFVYAPQLVENSFVHVGIGGVLGSLTLLALAAFLLYKITPFKKVMLPLGAVVGYFTDLKYIFTHLLQNVLNRYPKEAAAVAAVGAVLGIVMTVAFYRFNKEYTGSTSVLVRFITVFITFSIFQNIVSYVLYLIILCYLMTKIGSKGQFIQDAENSSPQNLQTPSEVVSESQKMQHNLPQQQHQQQHLHPSIVPTTLSHTIQTPQKSKFASVRGISTTRASLTPYKIHNSESNGLEEVQNLRKPTQTTPSHNFSATSTKKTPPIRYYVDRRTQVRYCIDKYGRKFVYVRDHEGNMTYFDQNGDVCQGPEEPINDEGDDFHDQDDQDDQEEEYDTEEFHHTVLKSSTTSQEQDSQHPLQTTPRYPVRASHFSRSLDSDDDSHHPTSLSSSTRKQSRTRRFA